MARTPYNVFLSVFGFQISKSRWTLGLGSAEKPLAKEPAYLEVGKEESNLSVTVVGASGDLAKKKIFPALFALFYEDCLPKVVFYTSYT